MEDLFAVEDADVEIVSRSRPIRVPSPSVEQIGEYEVADDVLARRPEVSGVTNVADDDLHFDYLPPARERARTRVREPFNLGLDEEVVIKQRAPQAKLDEDRLLGPMGIPKIRDEVSKKFRFRGKGHELQDLNRFIEHYQFWAHELFPKAKFRDALRMINKVGKTRSMKSRRRQIITDLLPKPEVEEEDNYEDPDSSADENVPQTRTTTKTIPELPIHVDQPPSSPSEEEFMLSDLEDDGPPPPLGRSGNPLQGLQGISNDVPEEMPMGEVDDMDDMDALEAMGLI